jgi:ABC-type transport system involved in multi-copper enzyme maturation permease subunit
MVNFTKYVVFQLFSQNVVLFGIALFPLILFTLTQTAPRIPSNLEAASVLEVFIVYTFSLVAFGDTFYKSVSEGLAETLLTKPFTRGQFLLTQLGGFGVYALLISAYSVLCIILAHAYATGHWHVDQLLRFVPLSLGLLSLAAWQTLLIVIVQNSMIPIMSVLFYLLFLAGPLTLFHTGTFAEIAAVDPVLVKTADVLFYILPPVWALTNFSSSLEIYLIATVSTAAVAFFAMLRFRRLSL